MSDEKAVLEDTETEDTEDINEKKEKEDNIAEIVLDNIWKMNGLEKTIQAQNVFKINGKKTFVRISNNGLTIVKKRNLCCFRLQKKVITIPSQNIVSVRTSLTGTPDRHRQRLDDRDRSDSYGTFRRIVTRERDDYEREDSRRLIFVGTMPDNLIIHYVDHKKETGIMKLKKIELHHPDNDIINWWYTTLLAIVNPNQTRPKQLLVFINPYGGHGTAKQIWESKIASIFKIAGIGCKVIVTESAAHAHNVIQSSPLHNFDGIISVGGDGMFSQVFNALIVRTARDSKCDVNDRNEKVPKPDIRVGLIPAGSTDSVAMILHGNNDPVTAALHIALGDRLDVDVSGVHTEVGLERFVMTMCSYGYFGDLMKHSENLRCLGRYRYDLSGVRTFLRHKSYKGTICYKPSGISEKHLLTDSCGEGCPKCKYSEDAVKPLEAAKEDIEEDQTVQITGKFLAILACNTSCCDRHAVKGMDTAAHTGDGHQDIIIVHKTSYFGFLRYLVRSAHQTGHPFTLPYVKAVRVKQWEFISDGNSPSELSTWNCDGEIIHDPNIFVRSHKQLVPVFARGVYNPKYATAPEVTHEDMEVDIQDVVLDV